MSWNFKRGDTFRVTGPHGLVDADGAAIDAAGFSLASAVRLSSGAVVSLAAGWVDGPANTTIELSSDETDSWPVGPARIDVAFTAPSGDVVTTGTMVFEVVDRVTALS